MYNDHIYCFIQDPNVFQNEIFDTDHILQIQLIVKQHSNEFDRKQQLLKILFNDDNNTINKQFQDISTFSVVKDFNENINNQSYLVRRIIEIWPDICDSSFIDCELSKFFNNFMS